MSLSSDVRMRIPSCLGSPTAATEMLPLVRIPHGERAQDIARFCFYVRLPELRSVPKGTAINRPIRSCPHNQWRSFADGDRGGNVVQI
jgi:hypothetical protein